MSEDRPMTDAEKMRLKRLARLGNIPAQPVPPPDAESATPSATPPKPVASSSRLEPVRPVRTAPAPVTIPAKRQQEEVKPVRPRIPYEEWEERTVSEVFGITLDRSTAQRSEWRLCWLKELRAEMGSEDVKPTTSVENSDRLLIARLSLDTSAMISSDDPDMMSILSGMPSDETSFEYLIGCWKRLGAANKAYNRSGYAETAWGQSLEKMRNLIISYCGMSLEDPTMFPQPANKPTGPAEFLPILLSLTPTQSSAFSADPSPSAGLLAPDEILPFLNDLANGVSPEQLVDTIAPTLSLFFQSWFSISPPPDLSGQEWRQYLGAVATLTQVKQIAAALPTLGVWVAQGVTAPKIEYQSILGPLTRLSVYPREFASIWKAYFSDPTERKVADIDANKSNLRAALNTLQQSLFNIYNSIIRASPESREGVLSFITLVANLNDKRSGMRVDHRTVASDGFMTNIHVVLLKLFAPVMDSAFSKIDKIDAEYFRNSTRFNIEDETKIRASKEEADEYFAQPSTGPPNFISDLFFMLNTFQHLGIVKTIGNRMRAEKVLGETEKELKRAEASRVDWEGNAALQAQGEVQIKRFKSDISVLHASCHAYDTQLLDPTLVRLNVSYLGFLMTWLVRLVDPQHKHPAVQISLPLPPSAPVQFRMLPEYLFDNIAEYLDFLFRYDPDKLDNADKDILITFVVTFLSPDYVNNPFLKAKLVSILSHGLQPVGYWRKGTLYDRLSTHSLSTQYLMPTLIRFFIDVESTGGHAQFWDKFNFRRDISHIFKSLWSNPLHREAFVKSRHDDFEQFIRFINMLMSDTTFHLEESLTGLVKINTIQQQLKAGGLADTEREDLISQLRQEESSAPYHTQFGLHNVELIRDLTKTTKEPFIVGEIVDRLAASLDENLATLVGEKMQDLKVVDPDKYLFKPKRLLAAIAQIYLNLGEESDFIRAVANDGRSYSKDLFERFAHILQNRAIMTISEVSEVTAFIQRVEVMRATIALEDEVEIPADFLDPLLDTLMRDPVILPTSKLTIDRSTIRTVLLSKPVDPFNNTPLKLEDCLPDVEMKARIDAWLAETRNKPAAATAAADAMEVD